MALAERRPLLVLSVDGLDHRYLRDADKMGLKIPNMRRIIREGEWADGVVGVVPTITWPSHTTLITGVPPEQHGILGNRRPNGGDYYWTVDLLKVKTLWHATRAAGLKSAAITWPVTVGADIDFNLPEYFKKRNGGAMDLAAIEEKGTPGLVKEITQSYPAFPHEWMDDRSRALATIFLLTHKRPDLTIVHFVDHDSEAHEQGPFTRDANGILEYTDELIGDILKAMPKNYVFALVSDHGFERIDRMVNIGVVLKDAQFMAIGSLLVAQNEATAQQIRGVMQQTELCIGREIPKAEVARFSTRLKDAAAVFEPGRHCMFGNGKDKLVDEKVRERGNHGLWPGLAGYRSTFALWGNGIRPKKLPETSMLDIAARFAQILEVQIPK